MGIGILTNGRNHPPMITSNEGLSLICAAPRRFQSIIKLAQSYASLHDTGRAHSEIFDENKKLGDHVYKITIGKNLEAAIKLFYRGTYADEITGFIQFHDCLKAKLENHFDTVTSYLATEDYFLMSLLPNIPS